MLRRNEEPQGEPINGQALKILEEMGLIEPQPKQQSTLLTKLHEAIDALERNVPDFIPTEYIDAYLQSAREMLRQAEIYHEKENPISIMYCRFITITLVSYLKNPICLDRVTLMLLEDMEKKQTFEEQVIENHEVEIKLVEKLKGMFG